MRLIAKDPNTKKERRLFHNYNFITGKKVKFLQEGGQVSSDMEVEQTTNDMSDNTQEPVDVQVLMQQFSESQDPNIAIQILTSLAQPETAAQVVAMLMQAMQQGATEQNPTSEVPMAKKGTKVEKDLFDFIYNNGDQRVEKEKKIRLKTKK